MNESAMPSSLYNLNKELPIPNGSPVSRSLSNNHHNKGSKNVANGLKTTSISSSNLFAKFNALKPLRSQPPTPTRVDSSSPFRIVHSRDRTPVYVPPGTREPKTSLECREALEEMYAISRDQQQRRANEEQAEVVRTGLQMQPSSSYQHHRYVSIMQDRNQGEQRKEAMVWVKMKLGDLNERILKVANWEDSINGGNSNDGTSSNKHRRPPPPPLPLKRDAGYNNTTPRTMMPPGRLHIPPPPSTPNSAGPALETIPASPASPSSTPTTTITTTTAFSWREPVSMRLPPTPTTPSPPRVSMGAGGRGHKRIDSLGSQPLRAPRPLSERPLISMGSGSNPAVLKDSYLISSPERPVATSSVATATATARSDHGLLRSLPNTVINFSKSITPTNSAFGRITEHLNEGPRTESPIELREYDELTTRRSRPRIPLSSVMESGDFQRSGDGDEELDSVQGSSNHYNDGENRSMYGSGNGSGNVTPVVMATGNRPGISIVTSASPEKRCFLCTAPIPTDLEVCSGNCQPLSSLHSLLKKEEEHFQYSDSEYDETSPSWRRTLSKLPSVLITPTKPLQCSSRGVDGEDQLTLTRDPRGQLNYSPASNFSSPEEMMRVSNVAMGWSRVSSPTGQLNNDSKSRISQTSHSSGTSASPTPSPPVAGALAPRPFSPISPASLLYSPGLRKGSASSVATSTSYGSSSCLGSPNEPSSALFHLERSIKNDPSWSPLIPGSPALPAGHEVLRLGRVSSGEGHQVVVVRAESVSCSSRESSDSDGSGEEKEQNCEEGDSETNDEEGDVVSSGSGESVVRPLSRNDGDRGDASSHRDSNGNTNHHDHDNETYNKKDDANTENRESGGSYGDWFCYYSEEARQNNAAVAAARYVHSSSSSSIVLHNWYNTGFSDLEEESLVSPITNCELFSNHEVGNRRRIMMLEAAAIREKEEEQQLKQRRLPAVANNLLLSPMMTVTTAKKTSAMIKRRRSSIYDRIQSIYDAYADFEGGNEQDQDKQARYGIL